MAEHLQDLMNWIKLFTMWRMCENEDSFKGIGQYYFVVVK